MEDICCKHISAFSSKNVKLKNIFSKMRIVLILVVPILLYLYEFNAYFIRFSFYLCQLCYLRITKKDT